MAAATIGSSLSSAKHAFTCPLTKNVTSDPFSVLKLGYTKTLHPPPSLVCRLHGTEPICVGTFPHMRHASRVAAMVASEEAVETAAAEEGEGESVGGDEETGEEQGQVNTKLYFGNLPYHCDSAQLAGIVQQYGTPELVEVLYNRDTGKSRGFAFVTMSSIEDCNAVIENLDGSEYGGRYLRVNFSDKPRKKEPLYPETEHKLFVGNLSWSVSSESLYQAFQAFGNVVGARVLYDGDTGKSRGYGFVCYSSKSEMENALASLNGMELDGRAMRVSLAEGKRL